MRLTVFTVAAMCLGVIAYAFGLGGTIAGIIFLFVLFNGVMDRYMQPLLERIRP